MRCLQPSGRLAAAATILKRVERRGWVEAGLRDVESVADHSFSLALLAMTYAAAKGLNIYRAVGMALLHDLAEAYTGDLTPRTKGRVPAQLLNRLEEAVLAEIFSELPSKLRRNYTTLYREYVGGKSAEARAVHMLDKTEMLWELRRLIASGRRIRGPLKHMLEGLGGMKRL
ncbi:MAG: HD domain-containing protein [Nitrososphaerota archaeon]